MKIIEKLCNFLDQSPVSFLVIENVKKELLDNGYQQIEEKDAFVLQKGGKYFCVRNHSSLIAFFLGENITKGSEFHIVASHSDSPTFKVKPINDIKKDIYQKVSVEPYGGMICSSWFDRPLSIAGRIFVSKENEIEEKLVFIDKNLLMIPNVCIHFNRDINKGYAYNYAVDMIPFLGQTDKTLFDILEKECDVKKENILNTDLYLYNRNKAFCWGEDNEYISSPRLDDLQCVYTSLEAFLQAENNKHINVLYIADNEEVGSKTRQGADGDFLNSILNRIVLALPYEEDLYSVIARSYLISADNAHAVHPNHPELTDEKNKVYMNQGIVIKFNASQSYTSDGLSSSIFQQICDHSNVPYQFFTNRADIRGGSTLGNIALSHTSMMALDIGLAQLAMHSSMETAGTKDVCYLLNALKAFYSCDLYFEQNRIKVVYHEN